MPKLKKIVLNNFCGYTNSEISFIKKDGTINNLAILFAPNGVGKSTLIRGIELVCQPQLYKNKETDLLFRKLIYNKDYDYMSFVKQEAGLLKIQVMNLTGHFDDNGIEKIVKYSTEKEKALILNELKDSFYGHCYYIDADNPINLNKFQIVGDDNVKLLNEMGTLIYGFKCYVNPNSFVEESISDGTKLKFYTDLIIEKYDNTKVHFKSMSGGEKKIAKLLEFLCDSERMKLSSIILIDSFDKEIYFKRHAKFIDCLIEKFPQHQFIIATHSGTLIDHVGKKYGEESLYDLEQIKIKELKLSVRNLTS